MSATGSFEAMHIQGGYTGTVTFGSALTVGTYSQAAGAIAQPQSSYELVVLDTFTWIGGTLNSTSTLSTVRIQGATGTVDPGASNTITTGSTLSMESRSVNGNLQGSSTTFLPGGVDFANGAGIEIGALSLVKMAPTPQATVTHRDVSHLGGRITVNQQGSLWVSGTNNYNNLPVYDSGLPLRNNGGTVTINSGAHASFSITQQGAGVTAAVTQAGGTFSIENGSVVTVSLVVNNQTQAGGMLVDGGDLRTEENAILAAAAQLAQINGHLQVKGDTSVLIGNGNGNISNVFFVTERVSWQAGSYNPLVSGTTGAASLWKAGSQFDIAAGVNLAPNLSGNPLVGQTWKVIQGNNVMGTTPDAIGDWTYLTPNPATELDVKWK